MLPASLKCKGSIVVESLRGNFESLFLAIKKAPSNSKDTEKFYGPSNVDDNDVSSDSHVKIPLAFFLSNLHLVKAMKKVFPLWHSSKKGGYD